MLSDQGSAVIRAYGILNTNIPQGHPFHGIPFPGDFLIAPDATVRDKFFLPSYETRPTASEVLLKEFGVGATGPTVTINAGDVKADVTLSANHAVPGQQLGVEVNFSIGAGWHIYGRPLPDDYIAASIGFDSDVVAGQSFDFPNATPVEFKALGETLPAYAGKVRAVGRVLIRSGLKPGDHMLKGTLDFQECSNLICKPPQKIAFEVPLKIEPMAAAAK